MNNVEYNGIVLNAEGGVVKIKICNHGSCEGCPISGCCSAKNGDVISVDTKDKFEIGDKVTIEIGEKVEKLGVLLSYVLPSIILFVSLLAGFAFRAEDDNCAYISVVSLAVYYLLLAFFRKTLNKMAKVTVKKTEE